MTTGRPGERAGAAEAEWLANAEAGGIALLELPLRHHRRDRAIAVGLADAHRRRAHERGMLYFLRQVGANAPTMACFNDRK
jgi:hypothetical protein